MGIKSQLFKLVWVIFSPLKSAEFPGRLFYTPTFHAHSQSLSFVMMEGIFLILRQKLEVPTTHAT
jgi:hypothetical protein